MLKRALLLILISFFAFTLPLAFKRPTGGRSAERQGQTAGVVRIYCEDSSRHFLKAPQVHFGNNPFNLEFTVFEWLQGKVAAALDGPECDSVEPVAKSFSVLCSALAILAVGLLAAHLWGDFAGVFAAILLATDELWLRYSAYSMIENRVLMCALWAIYFSLRRRALPSAIFWSLTLLQKPQIFSFVGPLWLGFELFRFRGSQRPLLEYLRQKEIKRTIAAFGAACLLGYAYFVWSSHINNQNDLPWVTWMGPRTRKWFLGNLSERFQFSYYKHLFLGWAQRSALLIAIPLALIFKDRIRVAQAFTASIPYLLATFALTFVFYPVFIVHEYYALPLNVGFALTTGGVLAVLLTLKSSRGRQFALLAAAGVLTVNAANGLSRYYAFAKEVDNPNTVFFHKDWNIQVFPKKHSLVAMAIPGSQRDLIYLYFTKQHGFQWCNSNQEFAPRAYWKAQGVEYVAWAIGKDSETGPIQWKVRTIDEELAFARSKGWSSDTNDAWAAHSMAEWAAISSRTFKDSCMGYPDPRLWESQ